MSVESRLDGAACCHGPGAVRSMRHGCRARELEGLSAAFTRLLPDRSLPRDHESEKVRFNQLNKNTGNRIRYRKVDAETGEEVESEDIIKGYQVSKGQYIEITDEDLEAVAVESPGPSTSTSSSRVRRSTTSTTSGPTSSPRRVRSEPMRSSPSGRP